MSCQYTRWVPRTVCRSNTWLIWYGLLSRAPYRTVSRHHLGRLGTVVAATACNGAPVRAACTGVPNEPSTGAAPAGCATNPTLPNAAATTTAVTDRRNLRALIITDPPTSLRRADRPVCCLAAGSYR